MSVLWPFIVQSAYSNTDTKHVKSFETFEWDETITIKIGNELMEQISKLMIFTRKLKAVKTTTNDLVVKFSQR